MKATSHYAIRGGVEGRERLRILARTMRPTTVSLFERLMVSEGLKCLDVGCGGGDVTLELAKQVGPNGKVVGVDIDETKLGLCRKETAEQGIGNAHFQMLDIRVEDAGTDFDVVYARFLLTHLDDPARAVTAFYRHLRPGGLAVVEDIDFTGYFTYPECKAFSRFRELYSAVVKKRGGDPNIGPRLPLLLLDAGFDQVEMNVVQPIALQGEVKLITPLTMENISDSVLQDGLASQEEIKRIVSDLYKFAEDPRTVAGLPRVIQSWGRRPAH